MKEKALAIIFCIFIALSMTGFIYAQWNDVITITNTMTFGTENMGFVGQPECIEYHEDPLTGQLVLGEYQGKEVGNCECEYQELKTDLETGEQGYDKLVIILNNAYPDYISHCTFTLKKLGTLPVHITGVIVTGKDETESKVLSWVPDPTDPDKGELQEDGKPILNIDITPNLPCNKLGDNLLTPEIEPSALEAEIAVQVTQNAKEGHVYTFTVIINYEVVP